MTWNYRAVVENDSETIRIHEVYYDKDGNVDGWTGAIAPACEEGGGILGMEEVLEAMLRDIAKYPVVLLISNNKLINKKASRVEPRKGKK